MRVDLVCFEKKVYSFVNVMKNYCEIILICF